MNNASVQQWMTTASGRPLLTLPPAAKVLGLNGEVPSQGPENPQALGWQSEPFSLQIPKESITEALS